MKIRLCASNEVHEVETLGALTPKPIVLDELAAGDVGFIVANIKRVADARMGDTVVEADRPAPPCRDSRPLNRWSSLVYSP